MIHEITVFSVSFTIQRSYHFKLLCFCSFFNLTVMDVFTIKNFFIKELNQYVGHFNKTELKTENVNNSL